MKAKDLRDLADQLFQKRTGLLSLWQEQADNFYPQRADFTTKRYLGDDFAGNMMTSFPMLCARELTGAIGTMLRNEQKEWFYTTIAYQNKLDHEGRKWLQWAGGVQRRAMYDIHSLFTKATAEADADFAVFGQPAIQIRLNRARDGLLYRTWHLRDMAWQEDDEGRVCPIFRRGRPTVQTMMRLWGGHNHQEVTKLRDKEPFKETNVLHMIVSAEMYTGDYDVEKDMMSGLPGDQERTNRIGRSRPYVSIFYDTDHQHLIEARGRWDKEYIIPRWQTVSGSQYAYSPAIIAALPDARLLQSMTYTLLEAGEKATNPPVVATEGAVRSDVAIYAGGITWVDYEYDERLGDALRPLTQDKSGLPIGIDMQRDCRALLKEAFYLNKLKPFTPTSDPQMTAFQAGQIVAQYIRDALPLFAPMEAEYNGQLCEMTFDLLFRNGAFGSPFNMPKSLSGQEIQFRFESPLHDAIEEQKGHKFLEMKQLIAQAIELDKSAVALPDTVVALRDALDGIKVPAKWVRSEVDMEQIKQVEQQQAAAQQLLATMQQGADVAATVGDAAKNLAPTAMAA